MFEFLQQIETQARAKDRTPPLVIRTAPLGQGGEQRVDGSPPADESWKRPAVSPVPPMRFTEQKNRSEYMPLSVDNQGHSLPGGGEQFLAFRHDVEARNRDRDLGNEIDQLDKQLRGMQSSLPRRETASVKIERTEFDRLHAAPEHATLRETVRTAVHDARQVVREARAEGATDDEILAEAATISPTCRRLYAALL